MANASPPFTRAPQLSRRRSESGLTLVELLVSIVVLTIIAGSIGGAFSIGIRVLGAGGSQQRLSGSQDLLSFEQQIGADVARAQCLASPSAPPAGLGGPQSIPWAQATSTGGCPLTVQRSGSSTCAPSNYLLCLAWFVPGGGCHTVTYWQTTVGGTVTRRDATTTGTTSSSQITTSGLVVTATWPTPTTSTTSDTAPYYWVSQVNVTVTQQGAAGAPNVAPANTTFHLVPLVVDPMSPVLAGSPC